MKRTLWIRTADGGKPSSSLTMAIVSWAVVMIWLVAHIFAPMVGLPMSPFNASEAMILLVPILGLYFGRRQTDLKADEMMLKHNKGISQPKNHPDVHPDDVGGEAD
jgi:hypothetical protein